MKLDPDIKDASKRASDIINEIRVHHTWDELRTKWLAISLADGSCDKILYDSKKDATRHQRFEQQCAYVSFTNLVAGSRPEELAVFLQFTRNAYKAGMRLVDPDDVNGGKDLAPTAGWMDYYRNIRRQSALAALNNSGFTLPRRMRNA